LSDFKLLRIFMVRLYGSCSSESRKARRLVNPAREVNRAAVAPVHHRNAPVGSLCAIAALQYRNDPFQE
jgi:hypothetical protein